MSAIVTIAHALFDGGVCGCFAATNENCPATIAATPMAMRTHCFFVTICVPPCVTSAIIRREKLRDSIRWRPCGTSDCRRRGADDWHLRARHAKNSRAVGGVEARARGRDHRFCPFDEQFERVIASERGPAVVG